MPQLPIVVGVDGCPRGWFATRIEQGVHGCASVHPSAAHLWRAHRDAGLILIDIPIGLRDAGRDGRRCDREARKHLRGRASSVFPVPCRAAVYAPAGRASAINAHRTGRKLSRQSLNILPKIREVDRLLRGQSEARAKLREIHPELLFWAFAGERPMRHGKKEREGFDERRRLLERRWSPAAALIDHALVTTQRGDVGRDDILDALAAAIAALGPRDALRTLPEVPELDAFGLPMEMVYRQA